MEIICSNIPPCGCLSVTAIIVQISSAVYSLSAITHKGNLCVFWLLCCSEFGANGVRKVRRQDSWNWSSVTFDSNSNRLIYITPTNSVKALKASIVDSLHYYWVVNHCGCNTTSFTVVCWFLAVFLKHCNVLIGWRWWHCSISITLACCWPGDWSAESQRRYCAVTLSRGSSANTTRSAYLCSL